jgi:hypothetical protein
MKTTNKVNLFCQSGSDFSIVDANGKAWTPAEAKQAWLDGRVDDYNLAIKRLSDMDWDVEKLKAHYASGGR